MMDGKHGRQQAWKGIANKVAKKTAWMASTWRQEKRRQGFMRFAAVGAQK